MCMLAGRMRIVMVDKNFEPGIKITTSDLKDSIELEKWVIKMGN